METIGAKQILSMAYHQQKKRTIGTEIKELQTFLRFCLDFAQGDWIELLPIALLTLKLEALLSEFYPTGRFSRDS